jgi:hypothetical protein
MAPRILSVGTTREWSVLYSCQSISEKNSPVTSNIMVRFQDRRSRIFVDKVALGHISLGVHRWPAVSIIPPVLHISSIYHQRYTNLATDSTVK